MAETTIWGIHAGQIGDGDTIFLKENCVALDWKEFGDLSSIPASRDQFKQLVVANCPDVKPGAVPGYGGQLFRFVHEIQINDLVAYPSKATRTIHIGRVTGPYKWIPGPYAHRRSVEWVQDVPRTKFSQGALYEIGSAITLFLIKNYAEEFLSAFEGKQPIPPAAEDETVAEVAIDIEETMTLPP